MTDREAARDLVRELLPELLDEALRTRPSTNGHHAPAPESAAPPVPAPPVPAPPVAAVLRPSTWSAPPAPGEVIGDTAAAAPVPAAPPPGDAPRGSVEPVVLDTDEDLERFVRSLLARFENPRDRMAIRAGHLRFTLRRSAPAAAGGAPVMRIEKGAVTERTVRDAADAGARLVLAPAAVLTPLARDRARALNVDVEREPRC